MSIAISEPKALIATIIGITGLCFLPQLAIADDFTPDAVPAISNFSAEYVEMIPNTDLERVPSNATLTLTNGHIYMHRRSLSPEGSLMFLDGKAMRSASDQVFTTTYAVQPDRFMFFMEVEEDSRHDRQGQIKLQPGEFELADTHRLLPFLGNLSVAETYTPIRELLLRDSEYHTTLLHKGIVESDGLVCKILSITVSPTESERFLKREYIVYLAEEFGWMPKKIVETITHEIEGQISPNQHSRIYEVLEFSASTDTPTKCRIIQDCSADESMQEAWAIHIDIAEFVANPNPPAELFEVTFPDGTRVVDQINSRSYVVGKDT